MDLDLGGSEASHQPGRHSMASFLFSVGIRRPQIEDDAAPENCGAIDCPDDLSRRRTPVLEDDTSPLTGMTETFPDRLPRFDYLILSLFKRYLDDALLILESLIRSQQSNALRLAHPGNVRVPSACPRFARSSRSFPPQQLSK
jgi:hypothetical protein